MTTLTLKPIEFKATHLEELGERVIAAFYPLIDDFRVLRETNLKSLIRSEAHTLAELVKYGCIILTPPYYVAFTERLETFLSQYGEMVLGITQVPTSHFLGGELLTPISSLSRLQGYREIGAITIAKASSKNKTAYVSTWQSPNRTNPQTNFRNLLRISTHEIGHIFGLEHHEEEQKTRSGKLCLMSSNPRQIQQTDYIFCDRCYGKLGISAPNLRT